MSNEAILIGELSRASGCHVETIRYYERIGVIPAAARRGRYRAYGTDDIARLRFIHRARQLGFSLRDVRELLALGAQRGTRSCGRAKTIAAAHVQAVRRKMADLERLAAVLDSALARCADGEAWPCPLLKSLEGATPSPDATRGRTGRISRHRAAPTAAAGGKARHE